MKKLILSIVLLCAFIVNAQSFNPELVGSTPDTTVTTAITYNGGLAVEKYSGIAGYAYTFTTGTSDTVGTAALYGSYDATNWKIVTTATNQVAGTYSLSDANPDYFYYKLVLTPQSGDSIFVSKVHEFIKTE